VSGNDRACNHIFEVLLRHTVKRPLDVGSGRYRFSNDAPRSFFCFLILVTIASTNYPSARAVGQQDSTAVNSQRPKYQVNLALDFEQRTYQGSERVRWTNRGDHAVSSVFFHLYANVRADLQPATRASADETSASQDDPHIEISEVKSADVALPFLLDDQTTILRVMLREPLAPGLTTEIAIKFNGSVPEIDPEETGLVTHVVKQVSAALRGEREIRRARDLNCRSRGVMLLGTAFPLLVVHDGDDWRRKVDSSVGDLIFTETADFEVTVAAARGVAVFAPGSGSTSGETTHTFTATALRDFAIVAGAGLRAEQRTAGDLTVRSVFLAEHEGAGQRVLEATAEAAKIYRKRFGPLPFKTITVAEAPLVAGLGSTEFSSFNVIASAFYIDFDSAAMRNIPELIREQRPSLEESLEWTVAHLVAHQWWGVTVGSDPAREPVLDEALAGWSALLYYREVYGTKRAAAVMEDQLRGVYRLYRTFGSEDMTADRPARDYRNSFQYAAIVMTKGALMFTELQRLLGDEHFFAALQSYFQANSLEIADMDDLRGAFIAEAQIKQRRMVGRTFNRWLSSKRGDEDIGPPDKQLAVSLGLPSKPETPKNDLHAFTVFGRLGKFFWQQMTRIP
jgi:hypothetical protein